MPPKNDGLIEIGQNEVGFASGVRLLRKQRNRQQKRKQKKIGNSGPSARKSSS